MEVDDLTEEQAEKIVSRLLKAKGFADFGFKTSTFNETEMIFIGTKNNNKCPMAIINRATFMVEDINFSKFSKRSLWKNAVKAMLNLGLNESLCMFDTKNWETIPLVSAKLSCLEELLIQIDLEDENHKEEN